MAAKKKPALVDDSPVFVVKLQNGLADRHRLPIDHVIRVLDEVRQMISDAGREILRERGSDKPNVDFGLELLAGPGGIVFQKGSIEAQIAITSNVEVGILATQHLVATIEGLSNKRFTPVTEADQSIVRRLNRVASIQQADKTELNLTLKEPGAHKRIGATFGEAARAAAWSIQAPVFQMEDMTVYGKLFELKDSHDESLKDFFWGELRRENGEIWRAQFNHADVERVASLFRKQVQLTGTANYYRVRTPRILVKSIAPDLDRDYEAVFDELYGCDKEAFPDGFSAALKSMREGE
jgi:hypothetical protein